MRRNHVLIFVQMTCLLSLLGIFQGFGQSLVMETFEQPSAHCPGAQVTMNWIASNLQNDSTIIELSVNNGLNWSKIGAVPKIETTYIVTMPTIILNQYRIRIVNKGAADTSNQISITAKPIVSVQMEVLNERCVGGTITFAPTILPSNATFTYQWFKDGQAINGEKLPTLTKNNLQNADAGIYSLEITGCEIVNTDPAILSLNIPTSITEQPVGDSVCQGKDVILSITAVGSSLTYQWKKEGANLPNETRASLFLSNITPANAGSYTCTVTGACGNPITSSIAYVGVTGLPLVNLNFTNDSIACSGSTVRLFATGINGGQFTYIWKKNGVAFSEQGPELLLKNIVPSDAAMYSVQGKNECNEVSPEKTVKIFVYSAPEIVRQTADTIVSKGSVTRLRLIATGDKVKYAWFKNNILLPKDTLSVLQISQTEYADSGSYKCVLSNSCATIQTNPIKLTVIKPISGPRLTLSLASVDFGCVSKNSKKDTLLTAVLKNDGESQLTISSVKIDGADKSNFSLLEGGGSYNLDPGSTKTLAIQFSASEKKYNTAELTIQSNSTAGGTSVLPLSGTSCFEEILSSTIDFGSIDKGSSAKELSVAIKNSGTQDMTIESMSINDPSFTIKNAPQLPAIIRSNDSLIAILAFNNPNPGTYTGTMSVKSTTATYTFTLTGTVKQPSGIAEYHSSNAFSLQPHPVEHILNFITHTNLDIQEIAIVDMLGHRVYIQEGMRLTTGESMQIATASLSPGTYYLILTLGSDGRRSIPFIKVR